MQSYGGRVFWSQNVYFCFVFAFSRWAQILSMKCLRIISSLFPWTVHIRIFLKIQCFALARTIKICALDVISTKNHIFLFELKTYFFNSTSKIQNINTFIQIKYKNKAKYFSVNKTHTCLFFRNQLFKSRV